MRRIVFALAACALAVGMAATAQEPKAGAPRPGSLQEAVEVLEARRDVRKARVKAAEGTVRATERAFEQAKKALGAGAGTSGQEAMKAEADFEAAKAQLEIRTAELKVFEVRVQHARKRLEEVKSGGGDKPPADRPKGPPQPQER